MIGGEGGARAQLGVGRKMTGRNGGIITTIVITIIIEAIEKRRDTIGSMIEIVFLT